MARRGRDVRRHFGPFDCAFTERGGEARRDRRARGARRARSSSSPAAATARSTRSPNGILARRRRRGARRPAERDGRRLPAHARHARRARPTRRAPCARAHARDGRGPRHFSNDARRRRSRRFFVNVASFGMGGDVIRRVKDARGAARGRGARCSAARLSFAGGGPAGGAHLREALGARLARRRAGVAV